MPTLIPHIAVDLDELLQNGTVTARAFRCESGRIVIVTVDVSLVLIVRVLRTKYCRAHGACEMLYVKLFVYDIAPSVIDSASSWQRYALHAVM